MSSASELPAPPVPLASRNPVGRVFDGRRKVRLGDVDRHGRLRFDALTRYTQDVSNDDTTDAGLDDDPGWVVRSTVVDELAPARLAEWLRFETFCAGLGSRWAERRLTITGDQGARYEVSTMWVCVDATSGRPHRLTDQFRSIYGEAAGERQVSAKQVNPDPDDFGAAARTESWQLRVADFDVYGHVNNTAYWAAVEEWLPDWSGPRRGRLEYGAGLPTPGPIELTVAADGDRLALWWDGGEGRGPSASASVLPLPPETTDAP